MDVYCASIDIPRRSYNIEMVYLEDILMQTNYPSARQQFNFNRYQNYIRSKNKNKMFCSDFGEDCILRGRIRA